MNLFLRKIQIKFNSLINQKFKNLIFKFSLIAIFLAGFPYWIIGQVPTFYEWTARHQLLFPLGISIFLSNFVFSLPLKSRKLMFSLLISISLVMNIQYYLSLYFDWNKQLQIIEKLSSNELIKDADLIKFEDNTFKLNALRRTYRFYEWNGLMNKSFNEQKRIGINYEGYHSNDVLPFIESVLSSNCGSHYKMSGASLSKRLKTIKVTINYSKINKNNNFVKKFLSKFFGYGEIELKAKELQGTKLLKMDNSFICRET